MAKQTISTKVVTGVVRLSYANIWEAKSINGGEPKYSASIIIPKNDKETIEAIHRAIDAAIEAGLDKFGGKKPNKAAIKLPLRDGDVEREDEAYANSYFINANSKTQPQIVDKMVRPILDCDEVYSGCYARVSLSFYAFNSNGNRGIAWQCRNKYNSEQHCRTPHLYDDEIKEMFIEAYNALITDKVSLIEDCRLMQQQLSETGPLEIEISELQRQKNKLAKAEAIGAFMFELMERSDVLTEFDEELWVWSVANVTVKSDNTVVFRFHNGTEYTAKKQ